MTDEMKFLLVCENFRSLQLEKWEGCDGVCDCGEKLWLDMSSYELKEHISMDRLE